MSTVFFITHPEVTVEPALRVSEWSLSRQGVERMRAFVHLPLVSNVSSVFSSRERRAREAARLLADAKTLPLQVLDELGENDRTSTGYLQKIEFESAADSFFAEPGRSFRGWETADAAQSRIVHALSLALAQSNAGDVAIVSHGAVGTLLKCWLRQVAITRREDQPFQGHYYSFDRETKRLLHDWLPLPAGARL